MTSFQQITKIGDITFKNRKKVVQLNSISNIYEHNERKTNEKPFTKWQNITPKTHMIAIFLPRMLIKFRLNKEEPIKKSIKKIDSPIDALERGAPSPLLRTIWRM